MKKSFLHLAISRMIKITIIGEDSRLTEEDHRTGEKSETH